MISLLGQKKQPMLADSSVITQHLKSAIIRWMLISPIFWEFKYEVSQSPSSVCVSPHLSSDRSCTSSTTMCVTSDKFGSPSRRRRMIPVVQNNRRVAGDWNHSHEMQHFPNQTDNNMVKASFNLCLTCYSFRTWGWLCRNFHTHTHTREVGWVGSKSTDIKHISKTKQTLHLCQQLWILQL